MVVVLFGTAISCSDYLDINDPKNDPTADLVSPDLVLAGALTRTYSTQALTMNRLGNVFMNNWAANVNAFTGGFNEEYQLIITSTFYNAIWDQLFIRGANFQAMIDFESEDYDNHKAIAKIMKSFYMQYLVDLYGDIPYSEAFAGGDNTTPVYDDQVTIYRNLVEEINEAVELINTADGLDTAVGAEDIIYGGDMNAWISFANTVKLRLLIRQATLAETDSETQTYLTSQFQSLQNASFITTDVTLNPGYTKDPNRANPFYESYGFNADEDETQTSNNRFIRASAYADDYLSGNITNIFDPRVSRLYSPIGESVVGVDQGIDSNDPAVPDDISALGDGLLKGYAQDGIVMTASEAFFLRSEAVFRGYLSGNAKELFQSGIVSSFIYLGVATDDVYPDGDPNEGELNTDTTPETAAEDYIEASNNTDEIGWDGSTNKIEAIMTQKWIATNGINAIESWIEYTRTGYPEIPLAQSAQKASKPNRLLYPSSESIANAANVPAQESNDAFTTYIFWDTTTN